MKKTFEIVAKDPHSSARCGIIRTPHGPIETPAFAPVASQGSVKALPHNLVESLGAQLILVNHAPLSIRFRYDEKRFDVDGAYDIRHEIIKSRIDKATVRGTSQRLTQPGRLAVVFSNMAEERETRRHLNFLRARGYLTEEIERLELEDLPGVRGLKALRAGVNLETQDLAVQIDRLAV